MRKKRPSNIGKKSMSSVDKWGIDTARLDALSSRLDWSRPPHIAASTQ